MRWGIEAGTLHATLPYRDPINVACYKNDFSPALAYSIAYRESIHGEITGQWKYAGGVESADGGHGLFQLTSWYPPAWRDPYVNAFYAVKDWLVEDAQYFFRQYDIQGEFLAVAVAASFNAGRGACAPVLNLGGHSTADILAEALDPHTSDNYASSALKNYRSILTTGVPSGYPN